MLKHGIGIIAVSLSMSSTAATVQLVGDTFIYEYDDVSNAGALALFGAPTIVGDTVRFIPPNFRAESLDGVASDVVVANFIFDRVYSTSGSQIFAIEVSEFGDYEIANGGSVSADLLLTASSNTDLSDFTSDSAAFDASGDSSGLQTWDILASINPANAFISGATDVAITIQNTLRAETNAQGETAWIQKKLAFTASEVPVPAAAWLFGSALLGLFGVKRKA